MANQTNTHQPKLTSTKLSVIIAAQNIIIIT
jgi:hypothetical protein